MLFQCRRRHWQWENIGSEYTSVCLCHFLLVHSQFVNLASGSSLRVGKGLESCTNEVQTTLPFELGGKMVTLIDTPGYDDTGMSDTDILKMLALYLASL